MATTLNNLLLRKFLLERGFYFAGRQI